MTPTTKLGAVADELDDLTMEIEPCFDDGRIDEEEVVMLQIYLMCVKRRTARLHEIDGTQCRAVREGAHRTLYGDDTAVKRRGLTGWETGKAA